MRSIHCCGICCCSPVVAVASCSCRRGQHWLSCACRMQCDAPETLPPFSYAQLQRCLPVMPSAALRMLKASVVNLMLLPVLQCLPRKSNSLAVCSSAVHAAGPTPSGTSESRLLLLLSAADDAACAAAAAALLLLSCCGDCVGSAIM
jgi:hypothetical protein